MKSMWAYAVLQLLNVAVFLALLRLHAAVQLLQTPLESDWKVLLDSTSKPEMLCGYMDKVVEDVAEDSATTF